MVQINAVKGTLKPVGISHAGTGNYLGIHNLGAAIQIGIQHDVDINFKAAVFCRLSEIIAEVGLEKCNTVRSDEEKMDK